jgi:hypothetical protein
MTTKTRDLRSVIAGIDALAKRVRADVRRATLDRGLTNNLELARLRKEAGLIAELIERYVRALRMELLRMELARVVAAPRPTRRRKRAA